MIQVMNIRFLNQLNFKLVSWFLVLVLFQTPIIVFLSSRLPGLSLVFKGLMEIYLFITAIIAVILSFFSPKIYQYSFIRYLLIYGVFMILIAVIHRGPIINIIGGLLLNLRFLIFSFVVFVTGFLNYAKLQIIFKRFWLGSIIVIVFAILQIVILPKEFLANLGYSGDTIMPYLTVDQNPNLVRINSTLRGPNMLGAFCVIFLSLLMPKILQTRCSKLLILGGLALIVLVFSWSRSAWLAAILALGIIALNKLTRSAWGLLVRATVAVTVLGGIIFGFVLTQFPETHFSQLFHQIVSHHNSQSTAANNSNSEHAESLRTAIKAILKRPFGHGIGTTGSMSVYTSKANATKVNIIENYFLAVGFEAGIVAAFLFAWLFAYVLITLYHYRTDYLGLTLFASGVGLGLISLVLPLWADNVVSYSWWGLVAIFFVRKEHQKHGSTKADQEAENAIGFY